MMLRVFRVVSIVAALLTGVIVAGLIPPDAWRGWCGGFGLVMLAVLGLWEVWVVIPRLQATYQTGYKNGHLAGRFEMPAFHDDGFWNGPDDDGPGRPGVA